MKDPAFWAAVSQQNGAYQPPQSAYAAPQPTYQPAASASATTGGNPALLLFGGREHHVFLGCLNCNKLDSGSVWNKFGEYGSRFSEKSIWNKFGTYGSKFSDECPWNQYGQTPPVIVDRSGNFYGYFTANKYYPQRTTIKAVLSILDNNETIMENFDDFVDRMR